MKKHFITALMIGLVCSSSLATDNLRTLGAYTIHYNALSTQSLSPDIAKAYGIRRSKNRGMINVAVRKKLDDGSEIPVSAKVDVHMRNIHAQITQLKSREIIEDQAIYYIAEFKTENNAEALPKAVFSVEVAIEGQPVQSIKISY